MKNLKKSIISAVLAAVTALTLTACKPEAANEVPDATGAPADSSMLSEETPAGIPEGSVVTVTDREGNQVVVPDSVERIVSASPSNTEILVGLGLKDKIVAADTYSYDAGIDPSLATIDMMNINLEAIIALSPDAVVINGMSMVGADDPYKALKDAGIKVLYIPSAASINDIRQDIIFLSSYTKTEAAGDKMLAEIDAAVARAKAVGETVTEKKKVYFEVSSAPYCYSCGKNTYINEILELIGAENIFAGEEGWLSASEESIVALNPDVILTSVFYDGYDYKEILSRVGWESVSAVKSGAVYQVDANSTGRASQNIADGINEIAKAVYPELFKD